MRIELKVTIDFKSTDYSNELHEHDPSLEFLAVY